eukprot:12593173-Alexandrium_andersonii.AAC.1
MLDRRLLHGLGDPLNGFGQFGRAQLVDVGFGAVLGVSHDAGCKGIANTEVSKAEKGSRCRPTAFN